MLRAAAFLLVIVAAVAPAEEPRQKKKELFRLHPLAKEANEALMGGDIARMKALLKRGLPIDAPLDTLGEEGPHSTALHLCCTYRQPEMMKFLLQQGANRMVRDGFQELPIDVADGMNNQVLCDLLTAPDKKDEVVKGIPMGLLDELLLKYGHLRIQGIVFVDFYWGDPPASILSKLSCLGDKVKPISAMEEISSQDGHDYRDKKTKETGHLVEFRVSLAEKGDPFAQVRDWRIRVTTAGALSGGGTRGTARKDYGYWLVKQTSSWDE